jgi:hypothetical protein
VKFPPNFIQSAATCSRRFLARGFFYPEDGRRYVPPKRRFTKIYMAPHPRRRHSTFSYSTESQWVNVMEEFLPPRRFLHQEWIRFGHLSPPCYSPQQLFRSSVLVALWSNVRNFTSKREVLGRIAYSPMIWHGPHRKWCLQLFFIAAGTSLATCYLATKGGYTDRPPNYALIRQWPHRKLRVQQFFSCCVYSLSRERVYQPVALQR